MCAEAAEDTAGAVTPARPVFTRIRIVDHTELSVVLDYIAIDRSHRDVVVVDVMQDVVFSPEAHWFTLRSFPLERIATSLKP